MGRFWIGSRNSIKHSARWRRGKRAGPLKSQVKECRPRPRNSARLVYEERDNLLLDMGFTSYSAYLKSDLWKLIRTAKLAVDPQCELCRCRPATQVHHRSYKIAVLQGKKQRGLVSSCGPCHRYIEFKENGQKRSFTAVYRKTKKLLSRSRKAAAQAAESRRVQDEPQAQAPSQPHATTQGDM